MKKLIFSIVLKIVLLNYVVAQITITSLDMPQSNTAFKLNQKSINITNFPSYANSGANQVWNFTGIISDNTITESYIPPTSNEIPLICRIMFNNPLDPAYVANVSVLSKDAIDPTGSIENIYNFYRTTSNSFVLVGRSGSIEGTPFCLKQTPTDTILKFPLTYGLTFSGTSQTSITAPGFGFFQQDLNRNSVVDAWGTLTTDLGTFDVLRVKSTLNIVDTIYSEQNGMGFKIPRAEIHYNWYSKNLRTPIFTIVERGQTFGGNTAFWVAQNVTNISEITDTKIKLLVYPNPASEFVNLEIIGAINFPETLILYNFQGKKIKEIALQNPQSKINIRELNKGIYFIRLNNTNEAKTFIVD